MSRSIRNSTGLIASLSSQAQDKRINEAGGCFIPGTPNRETRRRIAREERQTAKRLKQGEKV